MQSWVTDQYPTDVEWKDLIETATKVDVVVAYGLRPVLARHLGIEISKAEQVSDWTSGTLTPAQLNYAATDVAHLLDLHGRLVDDCTRTGLLAVLEASYAYLPARVALDIRGCGDVFKY